jgi:hypothetical protein
MSREETRELIDVLYTSYVNHMRKKGRPTMPCWAFRARLNIWKEW